MYLILLVRTDSDGQLEPWVRRAAHNARRHCRVSAASPPSEEELELLTMLWRWSQARGPNWQLGEACTI